MKSTPILAGVLACATAVSVTASSTTGSAASAATSSDRKPAILLDQGWSPHQRDVYYYTSQGALIMPAAFMEALQDAGPQGGRFMAPENLARLGVIPGQASAMNPYGWPPGFAIDTQSKDGIPRVGLTCAFCHTGQIEYHGQSVRIDGGAANIDSRGFAEAMGHAVIATGKDPQRRARFLEAVIRLGYPAARAADDFDNLYDRMLRASPAAPVDMAKSTPPGPGRQDAFNSIAANIFVRALDEKSNTRAADAPVNYPYVWDMWLFDYTQYNASQRQPMGRDIVEAIGHVGVLGFLDPVTGVVLPEPDRWRTTIRPRNLYAIRQVLDTLKPPPWPEAVLGKIDQAKAEQGRALFAQNCAGCHGIKLIKGTANPVEWHVPVIRLDKIGTDTASSLAFAGARFDASKLGLSKQASVAQVSFVVVNAIKRQAYLDAGIPGSEWAKYDGFGRKDTADPDPCGYKARPLIGTWATPPFLHNGAVRTIYDLLSDTRPTSFVFGGTEYDPQKLGFTQDAGPGTIVLDTKLTGNSNAGHWFTDDATRPGRTGRGFTEPEKYAIIEYLKAATPADYPTVQIDPPGPAPCADNPEWAKNWPAMRSN
ncbi:MAG: cytochrome c [Pseudomonadota bacterium]|nr:cytochrome c [Pseudomonadota bacterium]